ncbi:identical protein binding [Homalodisca vitripennis]|nr:identical protein binding [Homalodisca vitripennis]
MLIGVFSGCGSNYGTWSPKEAFSKRMHFLGSGRILCRICDEQEKTAEHLLFDFPAKPRERYAIFGSLDNIGEFPQEDLMPASAKQKPAKPKNDGSKKKPTSQEQWEQWKLKDAEFVDGHYEDDLQQAMLLSKLDYEEKQDYYDQIKKSSEEEKKGNTKKNKKSNKAQPMSLSQFNQLSDMENQKTTNIKETIYCRLALLAYVTDGNILPPGTFQMRSMAAI